MRNMSEIKDFLDIKIQKNKEILKYVNETLFREFVSESQLVKQINSTNGSQKLNIDDYINEVTVDNK